MEHKHPKTFQRVLSMFLCVAMLMSILVMPVAATETPDPTEETTAAENSEPQTDNTASGEETDPTETTPADETAETEPEETQAGDGEEETAVTEPEETQAGDGEDENVETESDETQAGNGEDENVEAESEETQTEEGEGENVETEPEVVEDEAVTEVIAMIDALPSSEDVESYMAAYEAMDDMEGLEGYLRDIQPGMKAAYEAYEALTDEQKAQVTNADKLMDLEWVWSMEILAETTTYDASAREDDKDVVVGDGITFRLFNYSPHINKIITGTNADGTPIYAWDPIVRHFSFRGSAPREGTDANGAADDTGRPVEVPIAGSTDKNGTAIPGLSSSGYNTTFDADGFTKNHATLKKTLDNGIPSLDLKHNAVGEEKTWIDYDTTHFPADGYYSLGYIFDPNTTHHAVSAYTPQNTLLIKSGSNHYTYNSKYNAVDYDIAANLFRVRNYVERNSATAAYDGYNDFLPFNYTGGKTVNSSGVLDGGSLTGDATADSGKYSILANDVDYWFGMTMEVEFYQTKDGILLGDDGQTMEDMIFKFSGDDDVWVFVDDVLVLDLGGTHGTVDGSINFATGAVKQYLSWSNASETATATSRPTTLYDCFVNAGKAESSTWKNTTNKPNETLVDGADPDQTNNKIFADYTKHTLKFFYLERGAAVANCSLDFRLPTLPDKSLTVGKELTVTGDSTSEEAVAVQNSLSYQFRVWQAEQNDAGEYVKSDVLFVKPGTEYDILENGTKIGSGTVDPDGYFSLRAGQQAQFTDMLTKGEGVTHYVVEEILPAELAGQYDSVEYVVDNKVTGSTKPEGGTESQFESFVSGAMSAEESQLATFRNKVDINNLGTLKITKQKTDDAHFEDGATFDIQVRLGGVLIPVGTEYKVGDDTRTVATAGIVTLGIGETAVFEKSILSGTEYEVTELIASGAQYKASYSGTVNIELDGYGLTAGATGVTGKFPLGGIVEVTVTNENFDFSGSIPITKTALGNSASTVFHFNADQVQKNAETNEWEVVTSNVAGTTITVTDSNATNGSITIAFPKNALDGTYYYKVSETAGSDSYVYDSNYYIVEINVSTSEDKVRTATISKILKNGTEESDAVAFTNQKTTKVIVYKYVYGVQSENDFNFTATIDGKDTTFPLNTTRSYVLSEIPVGENVKITEIPVEGYATYYRIGTSGNASVYNNDSGVEVTAAETTTYVYFYNVRYTVDDTVVIDYGLPVDVDVLTNDKFAADPTSVRLEDGTGTYGTASVVDGVKIRYTPNTMEMKAEDVFTYTVPYTPENLGVESAFQGKLTVIPATTIYYEDTFETIQYDTYSYDPNSTDSSYTKIDPEDTSNADRIWQDVGTVTTNATQNVDRPGADQVGQDANNVYGYDDAYLKCTQYSMGSSKKVTVYENTFAEATFSFAGTGFDIVSLTSNTTGTVVVDVYKAENPATVFKRYVVDTYYGYAYGDSDNDGVKEWYIVDSNSPNALYQVPVIKVEGLDYGNYTVVLTVAYNTIFDHEQYTENKYDFYLDAIRIYDPANDGAGNEVIEDAYVADGEGWPSYTELRNMLISVETFDSLNAEDEVSGVIFIDGIPTLDNSTASTGAAITDYKNYGPNNELYLANGQAVAFELDVTGDVKNIHLALKSVGGTAKATVYGLDANSNKTEVEVGEAGTISTATDLYYDITALNKKTVVIVSSGEAILSITNMKVTYNSDPNATGTVDLGTSFRMTRSAANVALASLVVEEEPVVFEPEKLDVSLSDSSVKVGSSVTLIVTTKTDVDHITVNGETVTKYSYNRWTGNRTWTVRITAETVGEMPIEVVAYDADGVASEPVAKTVTVTENYTNVGNWLKDFIGSLIGSWW